MSSDSENEEFGEFLSSSQTSTPSHSRNPSENTDFPLTHLPNLTRKNLEYNFNSPFLSTQSVDSTLKLETTKQTVQSETIVNLTSDFEDSDPLDSLSI